MQAVMLREVYKEDLEKILNWRNQEYIRNVMFNNSIIKWSQHLNWFTTLSENKNKITRIFMLNGIDYGVLNINNISIKDNTGSWGFYIGEINAPKGMGLMLGFTSLNFIFLDLGIRKLCAEIIESNKISCNYHEKLGFKLDGTLRKHIKRDNHYEDVYLYSLFAEEWQEKRKYILKELEERFK